MVNLSNIEEVLENNKGKISNNKQKDPKYKQIILRKIQMTLTDVNFIIKREMQITLPWNTVFNLLDWQKKKVLWHMPAMELWSIKFYHVSPWKANSIYQSYKYI